MDGGQLTEEQESQLAIFREVTANARDVPSSVALLQSCNWNVEMALQLHLVAGEEDAAPARPTPGASSAGAGGNLGSLQAPLLNNEPVGLRDAGPAEAVRQGTSNFSFMGWITRGLRQIGLSVLSLLRTFFGGHQLSGTVFTRALTAAYGADLQLPDFFQGSFSDALQAARRDAKLLVLYLHSDNARYTRHFCTEVLSNDFVREMLNENFFIWGGDIARMEAHHVSQLVRARQYPWFCVLLPASVDEIRVIGAISGEVQVDQASALLTSCLMEMESHRAEIIARREQHMEDRQLREQQDQEYQQALEEDRRRAEEQRKVEEERRAAEAREEERRRQEREEQQRQAEELEALQARRRERAGSLPPEDPSATSRLSLRLPAGQRLQRRFPPSTTLADVYAWAECAAYLPENEGKGLEIPLRFMLKMSFPSKDLVEMDRTIEDLQLAGSNILLAALEDDD